MGGITTYDVDEQQDADVFVPGVTRKLPLPQFWEDVPAATNNEEDDYTKAVISSFLVRTQN